jgi:CubicO group peptidase (beta-lactamase class C family)
MSLPFWPRDPYRFYDRRKLVAGLARAKVKSGGDFVYSNLGFDLLSVCLAQAASAPFNELLGERVLEPAGMHTARCQPCDHSGLVRGHAGMVFIGGRRWHTPLAGAGGVDASINDMAQWVRANLIPDSTPLAAAARLAHQRHAYDDPDPIGLAWVHGPLAHWHNGATGSFQSMIAVVPDTVGVVALASFGGGKRYAPEHGVNEWLAAQEPQTPTDDLCR